MKLIIEDDEGRKTVVPVVREEITIGRQDGNTIRLTERNVSRRHARFFRENGSLMLEDLGSYNGVRVNGDRIDGPIKVKEGDLIEIGDYDLGIQGKLDPLAAPPAVPKPRTSGESAKVAKKDVTLPSVSAPVPPPRQPEPRPEPVAAAPAKPAEPEQAPAPAATPVGQPAQAAGATAIIRLSDLAKPAGPVEIRDLPKSEMPRLVGLNGAFRGRELYLQKTEVKIGRTDDNDLGIDHQSISRQHCKFVLEEGGWKVYDNKSANGVRLNGEDYAVSAVKPGDTVELGHVKFRFCGPGERFTPPAEPAAQVAKSESAGPSRNAAMHAEPSTQPIAGIQRKPASKMPLFAGIGAAVVVLIAAGAFIATRGNGSKDAGDGSNLSAEQAVKQGDAAFAAHDHLEAVKLYEVAAGKGTTPKNMKKAKDEATAQQAYNEMQKGIASGDFDKAKSALDVLNGDPDKHWARQGQAKADAVKSGYVKLHLGKAQAAKASDPEGCAQEASLALQADPSNEEAQKVAQSCKGGTQQAAAAKERPRPEPRERPAPAPSGPSQEERNSQAQKLVGEGNGLYAGRDFDGAIEKFKEALALRPNGQALGLAYRGLGTAYSQKADKDKPAIVKYFKAYLPFAAAAEKPKVKQIIDYYSK